jgi:hypothetical protein
VPEAVRVAIAAGMAAAPEGRADLPRFLGMLREARWHRLAEEVLGRQPGRPAAVRLRAAVAVAPADDPDSFTPLPAEELQRRRLRTGDRVLVESEADADGHLTVLLLGSSGDLEVVLPRPTAEDNRFAARQRHRLLLRLALPAGRERVLVVWSRKDIRGSARDWQRWLERWDGGPAGPTARRPPGTRAAVIEGEGQSPPPGGSWRALVICLDHAEA